MARALENFVFAWKAPILLGLIAITLISFYWAIQLKPDAGFEKQLPLEHEYVRTHFDHTETIGSGNRILIVLEATEGDIWTGDFLRKLKDVNDALFYMKGIHKGSVRSLWTPNSRFVEVDEEGIHAENLIPGTITEEELTVDVIASIRSKVVRGGFSGQLVATDFKSALISANILENDPNTQQKLDMLALARKLENEIRAEHQTERYRVRIVGLTKMFGDVADSATSVIMFFSIALLLTALSVFIYSRSIILTLLPLACSLASLVWQFAFLELFGFGIDPLAILVPFLVFAIGVSHGIQQISLISKLVSKGATSEQAARSSFSSLLVPGSMALITDLVGFGTLWFIPIGMIQEMAITATIGVALKIITNLFMLPLAASYFSFSDTYRARIATIRINRIRYTAKLALIATPRWAIPILILSTLFFGFTVIESKNRVIGDLHAGSPLLKANHQYNVDSRYIAEHYSFGFDLLMVILETPPQTCINYDTLQFIDDFAWEMENIQGVTSVYSAPYVIKRSLYTFMEGNPKFLAIPRNRYALTLGNMALAPSSGLINDQCTVMTLAVFLEDAKAETISRVLEAAKTFGNTHELVLQYDAEQDRWAPLSTTEITQLAPEALQFIREGHYFNANFRNDVWIRDGQVAKDGTLKNIHIRLASGNAGLFGAINEEVEASEAPMLLLVYTAIVSLVLLTYRDWRAAVCCCLPLTLATFAGYWFMNVLSIGLKVSTLPVMVLAVGVGVDYAFYIYNRLQKYLNKGEAIGLAYEKAVSETGIAVLFTATTLALGVFTWIFSDLKFQADMGALLTFMFIVNAFGALIVLPSLAVLLDRWFPRKLEKSK